jgi:hypothetical protein
MTFNVQAAVLSTIEKAIIGEPRSQQTMIGPSEIGSACEHCLAAKLAGWTEREDAAWLPYVGTAMHAYLEPVFKREEGWLTETRVNVGLIADQAVNGTSDLFHIPSGTVIDHKLTGASTLKKAKAGPTPVYRTQAHLYGLGFMRAGYDVNTVAINYLPRNAVSLRSGVWWQEPFSPIIALDALDRATDIVRTLRELELISIEARDTYISSLPRDADCYSCARYPDAPKSAPTDSLDALLGLPG